MYGLDASLDATVDASLYASLYAADTLDTSLYTAAADITHLFTQH